MKNKKEKTLLISILCAFFIISIITVLSASKITNSSSDIITKHVFWYLLSFASILIFSKVNIKKLIDHSFIIYFILNILLLLLLFFGKEINGSKCWIVLPKIGSIQVSEFMKLTIILINIKIFKEFDKKNLDDNFFNNLILFAITLFFTLIPSILTFLEPDTGMVIIYFLITITMLFCYGINKKLLITLIILLLAGISIFFLLYFKEKTLFISVFGNDFFYRINRILDWSSKSNMQFINATSAIKAAGMLGFGLNNTPIYIPEAHTDFIFSVYSNNTGFVGSMILILLIFVFDFILVKQVIKSNDKNYKLLVIGFLAMLLYEQAQNIGMNVGILPITGITLPFISYGGSSLLSNMIGLFLIINYNKRKKLKEV